MSRHIAAPTALMLAAEEIEQDTASRGMVTRFNMGRHIKPATVAPDLCCMATRAGAIVIEHACGRTPRVEFLADLA